MTQESITSILTALLVLLSTSVAYATYSYEGKVSAAEFGITTLRSDGSSPQYAPFLTDNASPSPVKLAPGDEVWIEWKRQRDVESVVVTGSDLPPAGQIRVEYFRGYWPTMGSGGWMRVDDTYNGNWITPKHHVAHATNNEITYKFDLMTAEENKRIEKPEFDYRRTFRIKLIFDAPATIDKIYTYTPATWKDATISLDWKPSAKDARPYLGGIEALNARIKQVDQLEDGTARIHVQYSDIDDRLSADRGMLIFDAGGWDGFSVFIDDIIDKGGIYVRDIDAFISDASINSSYADYKLPDYAWDATIKEKVSSLPEQTLANATKDLPELKQKEVHIGVPDMRQEFTVNPSGNIALYKESLRAPGVDLDRRSWIDWWIQYWISTDENPSFTRDGGRQITRWLEDDWLPIVHTKWQTGPVNYNQSCFSTVLAEKIDEDTASRTGSETLVCMDKINITNTSDKEKTAYVWLEISNKTPMELSPDGLIFLPTPSDGKIREELIAVRGWIDTNGKGELTIVPDCVPAVPGSPSDHIKDSDAPRPVIKYSVNLAPGESHVIYFNLPYIELLTKEEVDLLKSADYDDRYQEVRSFWTETYASSMQYDVPEKAFVDFWKSNLWRTLITTDKDPETGLYQHFAATMHYKNYINETVMVIKSLEMRGLHDYSALLLKPFVESQGTQIFLGTFQTKEGVYYATHPDPENDPYTSMGYNMHHGWALWGLAEHYFFTKDKDWLHKNADSMVAACDWIIRERQNTMHNDYDGTRPVHYGLAPAGELEDVLEFLYWYATNGYYYIGLHSAAEALADIDHPESERLAREAREYRAAIRESLREATLKCPVVELADGTWVPYVPGRAHGLTHKKEGWIREALYPALHLVDTNVLSPCERPVDWILQDLEDNIFMSCESGYCIEDKKDKFMSLGGFTKQPNLLTMPNAYLRRDEVPNYLRALFNNFALSVHKDVSCFSEWVKYLGDGRGPLFKTPDECNYIQFMRNMLVLEEDGALLLGMGVPQEWMTDGKHISIENASTVFGDIDMKIESHAGSGKSTAIIATDFHTLPSTILLRVRHPQGQSIERVTVNGNDWYRFDTEKETIELSPDLKEARVEVYY